MRGSPCSNGAVLPGPNSPGRTFAYRDPAGHDHLQTRPSGSDGSARPGGTVGALGQPTRAGGISNTASRGGGTTDTPAPAAFWTIAMARTLSSLVPLVVLALGSALAGTG